MKILWLDVARVLSIFFVIVIHIAARVIIDTKFGLPQWWIGNIYDSLARWCVPVFVMVSGALLLDDKKQESLSVFYKKRLLRIFWPTVFWTGFYICWSLAKTHIKHEDQPDIRQAFYNLITGNAYSHLWFIYMMVGLYFFTPVFRDIVEKSSKKNLLFFTVAGFFIAMTQTLFAYSNFQNLDSLFWVKFLYYTPFFFTGHLIANSRFNVSGSLLFVIFFICLFLTAVGFFVSTELFGINSALYFYDYLSVTVVPMAIAVMFLVKKIKCHGALSRIVPTASNAVLGIYLVHPVFIDFVGFLGYGAQAFSKPITLIFYIPLMSLFIFSVSFLVTSVISRLKYLRRIV